MFLKTRYALILLMNLVISVYIEDELFFFGAKGCSFLVEPSLGLVLKSSFCNFNCLNDPLRILVSLIARE